MSSLRLGPAERVERDPVDSGPPQEPWSPRLVRAEVAKPVPATLPYIPLVRAMTIERMPDLLERMNVRFEDLLKQAGLPQVPLDRHANFLPLGNVLAVVDRAARATGIEHFALLLATAVGLDALDDYGRYIKAAPTLLEAIRRAGRYVSWHTLGARLSLTSEGTACVWRYELSSAVRNDRRHAYPFALVMMRDVVRLAAGPHWLPREIRLEQPVSAGCRRPLEEAFGQRIRWGAGENALVFGQSLLTLPLSVAGEDRNAPASDAVARALESNTPPADFTGSLRQLIRSFLSSGYPNATMLAHASGLPLRSFQRAIALRGVSFSDLVEQVRFQMAVELMRDPRARLIDIGLELGYSDAANFTRAFKRWTGQSPRQYRHTLA
jgi:AraC-like DNA-binding protein